MVVEKHYAVKIGDKVRMVHHDQSPSRERPEGPYEVVGVRVYWQTAADWLDVYFELQHPDGWTESRPWYLCVPAEKNQ